MPLLIDWLISAYPRAKRQTLREMLRQGRVRINGQVARSLKQTVDQGDSVQVNPHAPPPRAGIAPLRIIHEDDDILVVFKPAGLLTSTVARERRPTALALVRACLADRQPRARVGLIHRLDRDASGLLVFSKNRTAYESLKCQFFEHSVQRQYVAVVRGKPSQPAGRIKSRLVERPDGSMVPIADPRKGHLAITDYQLIASSGQLSVLRITLHTGRKHQIRAQLSRRGMPVVGDTVYGNNESGPLMLCAVKLGIRHPSSGRLMEFEVSPPREIRRLLKDAGVSCEETKPT